MSEQKQRLQLKQTQALHFTPQLEKSLHVLQCNQQQLALTVTEMLASNVMLTTTEEALLFDELSVLANDDDYIADSNSSIDEDIPEQIEADMEWEDVYDSESEVSHFSAENAFDDSLCADTASFDEALENAIYMAFSSRQELTIARLVLAHLNEHYFLTLSTNQLANKYRLDKNNLIAVIEKIKHLEPAGVASQNIQECLLAQLHNLNIYSEAVANAHEILSHYFAYIGYKPELIMKRLSLDMDEYVAAMAIIQQLSPYPNDDSAITTSETIRADVYVHQRMGIYYASLNEDARFDIHINQEYAALAAHCQNDEKRFITAQLREAKAFIRALKQRDQTILRIANAIVIHQQNYFQSGDLAMQALSMQEVAQLLQLHESTISRAVNGKYLSFNHQLIELRYFFSNHLPLQEDNTAQQNTISTHVIKTKIKALIENENPKNPLSDTKIEKILAEKGIDISRRTVSKYREQLGFLKTSKRKSKN